MFYLKEDKAKTEREILLSKYFKKEKDFLKGKFFSKEVTSSQDVS